MEKRAGFIIAVLVILVAACRMWASLSVPYLSDDASYENLRLTQNFSFSNQATDPLSFGGRTLIIHPVSTNILALFNSTSNTIFGYKIILNFIASLQIAVIFLIALRITKKPLYAVLIAILAACVPVQYLVTLNSISIIPFAFLFFLLAIYYYIAHIQQPTKTRLWLCIILFLFCSILHPLFLVIILGLFIYQIYSKALHLKLQRFEVELLVSSFLVALVVNYAIYAKAFLAHGLSAFYQSTQFVPYAHVSQIISLLPQMGLVIFAAAMYTIFQAFENRSSQFAFVFAGIITAAFIAMLFQFISADIGLLFISVMSVLLLSQFFNYIHDYFSQTKIHIHTTKIIISIWILFFVLSIIPTLIYSRDTIEQSTSLSTVDAFAWVKTFAEPQATVIVPIRDAQTAMYFSERKTVMDQNVLLVADAQSRADAINSLYTTPYPTTILATLKSLGITKQAPAYIVFSNTTMLPAGWTQLGYRNDCFSVAYSNDQTIIFKSLCEVQER